MAEQAPNGRPNNFVPQPGAPYAHQHERLNVPIPGSVLELVETYLNINTPPDQISQAAQDASIAS